jgi:hypothetical protein
MDRMDRIKPKLLTANFDNPMWIYKPQPENRTFALYALRFIVLLLSILSILVNRRFLMLAVRRIPAVELAGR